MDETTQQIKQEKELVLNRRDEVIEDLELEGREGENVKGGGFINWGDRKTS